MGTLEGRFDQRHQYITYMSCKGTDLPKSLKTDLFPIQLLDLDCLGVVWIVFLPLAVK